MNPHEFARRHLGQYKVRGSEIVASLCPFCGGGTHKDRETFALNVSKLTFNCKRGSCGRSGTFWQLCREFGEEADRQDNYEIFHKQQRVYKKPAVKIRPITNQAEQYLSLRKISRATLDRCGVGTDDSGNILFTYYDETGEHVFTSFRPAKKLDSGDMKAWRETNTKPVLYLMNLCTVDKPLIITEGQIDALSLIEAGIENAVSVPSGSEDFTWLDTCWNWLQQFNSIILFGDNDVPGRDMVQRLIIRLGTYRCSTIPIEFYKGCKDANEILYRHGKDTLKLAVENAKPIPIAGLIDLADVKPFDVRNVERVKSNISFLDAATGGFLMGELSVWTGKRGHGKSTLLGQLLLEAVDQGTSVCAYSGELRADRFQYWINLQAAGSKEISRYYDAVRGKEVAYIEKSTLEKIMRWYRGKFFLYDNGVADYNAEETSILKVFEYTVKRYDCRVFLIDNLMTARYACISDADYYRQQSAFVGVLVSFAKRFNVHVHLVAHPRKTHGGLDNDDIGGSGDITNRADNVFSIERVQDAEFDVVLNILKNRSEGAKEKIGLKYSPICRRLYLPSIGDGKQYGWSRLLEPVQCELWEGDQECPF
jgi:twinkle protein